MEGKGIVAAIDEEKENKQDISSKELSNEEKAKPLEKAIRIYLGNIELYYGIVSQDLTRIRNFKRHKGERVPDFLVFEHAVIEAKNWDNTYVISQTNVKEAVLDRFAKYAEDLKRILIIANPNWGEGVKEYLIKNRVQIIELGFVVTSDNWVDACERIETELDEMLFQETL